MSVWLRLDQATDLLSCANGNTHNVLFTNDKSTRDLYNLNISLDVEFWNQKRAINPNGTTNSPLKPNTVHQINGHDIYSSKGFILHEMFSNDCECNVSMNSDTISHEDLIAENL